MVKLQIFLMGFVSWRSSKSPVNRLSETINISRKLHKTNVFEMPQNYRKYFCGFFNSRLLNLRENREN